MAQIKILLLENDITRGKEIMGFFTAEGNRVEWVTEHEACQKWLDQEQFQIETQGTTTYSWGTDDSYEATYEHFVVRKR